MKNKNVDIVVLVIIIVIVAITASATTWLIATKTQTPVIKQAVKQQNNTTVVDKTDNTPIIAFKPDTFTAQEKTDLLNKIINPYIDFTIESEASIPVSISVTKMDRKESEYMYTIEVIFKSGGYSDWLEREFGNPIRTWSPQCMGECNFSDQYRKKYPEVIKKYNETNK